MFTQNQRLISPNAENLLQLLRMMMMLLLKAIMRGPGHVFSVI